LYINRAPRSAELEAWDAVLAEVMQLLPGLTVVFLHIAGGRRLAVICSSIRSAKP
jgi:hypothetical protein